MYIQQTIENNLSIKLIPIYVIIFNGFVKSRTFNFQNFKIEGSTEQLFVRYQGNKRDVSIFENSEKLNHS